MMQCKIFPIHVTKPVNDGMGLFYHVMRLARRIYTGVESGICVVLVF